MHHLDVEGFCVSFLAIRSGCVRHLISLGDLLKGGNCHRLKCKACTGSEFLFGQAETCPLDVSKLGDFLSFCKTVCNLNCLKLTHPINQKICLGVLQDGFSDKVLPVVVMGKSSQRGLNSSDNYGSITEGLLCKVGVDNCGPVRSETCLSSGGVLVQVNTPIM